MSKRFLAFAIAAFSLAGFLILNLAVNEAREAARCSSCLGLLRANALAILNYESSYGHFPAPTWSNGLHSWRTLTIQFSDDDHPTVNPEFAWNDKNNTAIGKSAPTTLQCHSRRSGNGFTQFFCVNDKSSIWQSTPVRAADVKDGLSQTLLLIELDLPSITWTSPKDVTLNELLQILKRDRKLPSPHPDFIQLAFADGSVRQYPHSDMSPDFLSAIVSIDGGEPIIDIANAR